MVFVDVGVLAFHFREDTLDLVSASIKVQKQRVALAESACDVEVPANRAIDIELGGVGGHARSSELSILCEFCVRHD